MDSVRWDNFESVSKLAGTAIEEDLTFFTSSDRQINGSVHSRVVLSKDGTYDFYWRIFNDGPLAFGGFRIGDFFTETYDADFRTDSSLGDLGPDSAYLHPSPGNIIFRFSGGLAENQESLSIFLDTNATNYAKTAVCDITALVPGGGISRLTATFAPADPVPEPATTFLFGTGLAGLVGSRIRRKKKA